jgi:ribose/xylose/arabinose/galactoside ABC-type transport system permease subunit
MASTLANLGLLVSGVVEAGAGVFYLKNGANTLFPESPKNSLADDAFACAIFSLGLSALLAWWSIDLRVKRTVALSTCVYHLLLIGLTYKRKAFGQTVWGQTSQQRLSGTADQNAGLAAVVVHGVLAGLLVPLLL